MRAQSELPLCALARHVDAAKASSVREPKSSTALLAAILFTVTSTACGGAASITHQSAMPVLSGIYLTYASMPSIRVGSTLQFAATGVYSVPSGDAPTKDVTSSASWTTSDANIATVEHGLITGTGIGAVIITATLDGKSDSRTAVVGLTPTIAIGPTGTNIFSLSVKQFQFSATATYSDGTTLDATDFANWTSSPTGILKFYPYFAGDATFIKTGSTTITATFDTGEAPTKDITVVP